ncbi:SelB C-terminal domain-containing protein [Methylobacterium fujisawaense]|uniref:SelB domain-containing protein n=2 Tax=Methylobacterium TaxID=407 RepID=UPI002F35B1F8
MRSVAALKTLLVGVIGHVDHGKTALVRALTGVETDRLKEERARGVSIVPGFALLTAAQGEIDLVDLPGHERFVRAMISGATGMRAVLLAVDAHEGIKPQTVEHLEIAALIGVRRGVLALTKADLATRETVAARAAEIAAAAARAGIEAGPVIATSTVTGDGLPDVAQAGALWRRAEFDPARNESEAARRLEQVFRRAGLSPPDEAEAIGRDVRRREALTYLVGAGTVIRAVDRVQRRAVLFHREAVATAKSRLIDAFPTARTAETGFLAREAGATLGISRKFSIPLLEHLDATGFTRRAGDRRVIVALEPGRAVPDAG